MLKAANRALEIYILRKQANDKVLVPQQSTSDNDEQITIKIDKKFIQVRLNELYYLESFGNYVKVWKDGEYLLTPPYTR